MTKYISRVWNEEWADHRAVQTMCPHCKYCVGWDDWAEMAERLVLEPRFPQRDCVVVISECPGCFAKTWCHFPRSHFHPLTSVFPASWVDVVNARRR